MTFFSKFGMVVRRMRIWLPLGCLIALAILLRLSPLNEIWSDPERLAQLGAEMADSTWMPLLAVCAYLLGAVFLFPVTVLFLATAYIFDPLPGLIVALSGVALSGALGYIAGNALGTERVKAAIEVPYRRLSGLSGNHGVLWVAMVRHVPIAPFTVVNMAIGCTPVTFPQFILGTVLGLTPSIGAIILLRRSLAAEEAGSLELALLFGAGALFIITLVGTKRLLQRRLKSK